MKKPISRFYLLLVLVPLLLLTSMGGYYFLEETAAGSDVVVVPQIPAPPSATPGSPSLTPEPTPHSLPREHDITLMAVGDNLMHLGVVASGKQEDGTYDFSMLFQGISPFLNAADIRIINQETVMAAIPGDFPGFPYFNSPTEVGMRLRMPDSTWSCRHPIIPRIRSWTACCTVRISGKQAPGGTGNRYSRRRFTGR